MERPHTPWWGPIALSVGFLTIVPMPAVPLAPAMAGRASVLFRAIGALIGLLLGGLGLVLDRFLPPGPVAALLIAAAGVVVLILGRWLTRQLGGLTGDGYGAVAVLTESVVLFIAVALAAS